MANSTLTEQALDRLASPNKHEERMALAQALGQQVFSLATLANRQETMRYAGSQVAEEFTASGDEYKIGRRVAAWLNFVVHERHNNLQGTPGWLRNAHRVDLNLQIYDIDLPDNLNSDVPDAASSVVVSLVPAAMYGATETPVPYTAYYDGGEALDSQDTNTLIGALKIMASEAEVTS